MIETIDEGGDSYYITPEQICYIHLDVHCRYMEIQTTQGLIEVPLNRQINRDALQQLTRGNRLINQEEQKLIKKHNQEALD